MDAERVARTVANRSTNLLIDEVTRIFENAVGYTGASPEDNLASIGGDSLQAVSVLAELERRYRVEISDELIAMRPTIREIAHWIDSEIARRTESLC
jgi:acyl carrier protein